METCADGLLEDLPHILCSHIKALPNLALSNSFFDHLLVVPADVCEDKLVEVKIAILSNFPEGDGCDGIVADVEFSTSVYLLTHFDHSTFFDGADLALPADTHDDVSCFGDGETLKVFLEVVIEVSHGVPPHTECVAPNLANVKLLVVIFPLEAGCEDAVVGNVLDRVIVLMLLPLAVLLTLQLLLLLQDLKQSKAFAFCQVTQVLTQSQQETSIHNHLLSPFETGVELAFPADGRSSVVEAPMIEGGVAIGLSSLPFELYDIVFVVDGVGVDVGALGGGAVDGAVL